MSFDRDSSSREVSPAAVILVVIGLVIVGVMWWVNSFGAGGAPQPTKLENRSPTRPFITPQPLTNDQLHKRGS